MGDLRMLRAATTTISSFPLLSSFLFQHLKKEGLKLEYSASMCYNLFSTSDINTADHQFTTLYLVKQYHTDFTATFFLYFVFSIYCFI
jgi:hypothetical protein